ncbi:aromatic ring-hydroxylating oxygenase subunit alpha [Paraburkholderia fungorum]|uniref:aromatic ring-hydroxylating oxygenase subunit alpha n=1 Tax=Paraburkholderia fungorum TaxID=134537 RepID=UPI001C1F115E|nr:aromatic ring-hydroxylating dioxygenase subunit alpha [Paraburkholderia fungorum]MBU7436249.1 aromatic ring-hydroxylating dioxygenase subunit alpha [Paraburkholderia fungorum]
MGTSGMLAGLLSDLENDVIVGGPGDAQMGKRSIYTDPLIYQLEMEHLFEGCWVYAAHESQLSKPHDYLTISVGRQPVVLTRDEKDQIRAFLNVCSHRGSRIVRARKGNQRVHTCMFHGWCYNSAGELINISDEEDGAYPAQFDCTERGLMPVRCESYRGFYWVSLNPKVQLLSDYLNGVKLFIDLMVDQSPTGELEVLPGETAYTYAGNWKLQGENGLDGYHVKSTHGNYIMTVGRRARGLSANDTKTLELASFFKGGESGFFAFEQGHGLIYGPYPNYSDRPNFEFRDQYLEHYGKVRTQWMTERMRNLLIMPNVLLMDQMSTQIRVFRPLAVDRTEVTTYCIAPKGESAQARERRLRQYEDFFNASGMATPDDLAEFRNCQIGFEAKGAAYSDLSRGQRRWQTGSHALGQELGVQARMSSTNIGDEGLYVSIIEEWARRMRNIVADRLNGGEQ